MADGFDMYKKDFGNGRAFHLTPQTGNGWIAQMHAAKGLFASSIWFTPKITLSYTFEIEKPCMWIFGMDCGDIVFSERGKPTKHLSSNNHIVVNSQKTIKITFPANVHVCCTCVFVFDDFIENFMSGRTIDKPFNIEQVQKCSEIHYNTPDITLVLEQIKWAARNAIVPLFNYECKLGELLSLILRNTHNQSIYKSNRRYHVTWENEQKLYRIKNILDIDILNPPSIEKLSQSEAMSVSKLHRCFKQFYKMTLLDYIRIEKMKIAMLMLADDELNIKNIAQRCGYESPSKFTAAFKNVHNITPSQYRKSFYL